MNSQDLIMSDLIAGLVVKTSPADQVRYKTNQVPDSIRKLRKKHGYEMIETTLVKVVRNGRATRVAEYRIPIHFRKQFILENS